MNWRRTRRLCIFLPNNINKALKVMGAVRPLVDPERGRSRVAPFEAVARIDRRGPMAAELFLHALETPSFLLDRGMLILCSNVAGQRLLADSAGLACRGGRLCMEAGRSTEVLADTVARIARQGSSSWQADQVRITSKNGSDAFTLGLTRWMAGVDRGRTTPGEPTDSLVLAIAYPTRPAPGNKIEHFGLTVAEARVGRDLIAGLSPKAIALRQGRSLTTIRTHLARLMAKTETNRQSHLVLALTRGRRGSSATL